MAALSAFILGTSRIYVGDRVPERLSAASKIPQCTPIDFSKSDPVDQIIKANGDMVDRAVDCVGYQAVDQDGRKEGPNIVLENLIRVTRACGGLGILGLYVPQDPGSQDESSAKGQILISFGKLFEKICPIEPEDMCIIVEWRSHSPTPSFHYQITRRPFFSAYLWPISSDRPVQRQSLQPLPARPDHRWPRQTQLHSQPRDWHRSCASRV